MSSDSGQPDRPDVEARLQAHRELHARDDLTEYVLRHFERLLRPAERAAIRYRTGTFKTAAAEIERGERVSEFWGLSEMKAHFPELFARMEREGTGAVLREARERVLREHAAEVFLNLCPKCQGLCRTPRARQCFRCGHDWHDPEGLGGSQAGSSSV